MKKGLIALLIAGAAAGAAAAIIYDKIEEEKAKKEGVERAALKERLLNMLQKQEEEPDPMLEICYYAERGSVYHMSRSCRHIADRDDIVMATVGDAIAAGKERVCSLCKE